jgi:hypothetical protein
MTGHGHTSGGTVLVYSWYWLHWYGGAGCGMALGIVLILTIIDN